MEFQNIVRAVLRLIFAAGGLVLLFLGSFSKSQFEDRASLKGTCFIILSLGVGFFVYKPLKCNDMFENLSKKHFLVIAVVKLLLLGLFSMVIFFTKYPGLKIHQSEGKRSGKVYDLLGVGSFSVFALVISWERQHGGEGFGVFEFMLELTMDASMEVPAGRYDGSGPNLCYMVGAYVYCFLLLIIRSYGDYESGRRKMALPIRTGDPTPTAQNIVRTGLRLIFAAGGLILLFHGSFSNMQFENRASLKGMCFIILSLGVGFFVYKPLKCNDMFENLSKKHFLVIAVVKLLLLGLFSMLIFFTKYPALKIHHSEGNRSRKVYDLLGVGSISAFALVISWERQHGGEGFGVFEFMLELTMDASMEIPAGHDDGSGPNLWYMVGAYVYCFLLLIIRSYGNSLSTEQGNFGVLDFRQDEKMRYLLRPNVTALDLGGLINFTLHLRVLDLRRLGNLRMRNFDLRGLGNLRAFYLRNFVFSRREEHGSQNKDRVEMEQGRNDDADLEGLRLRLPEGPTNWEAREFRRRRNALEEEGRDNSSATVDDTERYL